MRLPRQVNDRVGSWVVGGLALVAVIASVPWLGTSIYQDEGTSLYSAHLSWSDLWTQSQHQDLVLLSYYVLLHFWLLASSSIESARLPLAPCVWRRRLLGRPNRPAHWRTMVRHHRLCPRRDEHTSDRKSAERASLRAHSSEHHAVCGVSLEVDGRRSTQPPVAVQHLWYRHRTTADLCGPRAGGDGVRGTACAAAATQRTPASHGPASWHNGPRHSGVRCGRPRDSGARCPGSLLCRLQLALRTPGGLP